MSRSVLKTRQEWFEDLPEPTRTMAINNTNPKKLRENVINILIALDSGFIWKHSTEGHDFWEGIYLKERYGEEKEGTLKPPGTKIHP